jgi:hypothetical protein
MVAVAGQRLLSGCLSARRDENAFAERQRAWFPNLRGVLSHTGGRDLEQLAACIAIDWSDAKPAVGLVEASTSQHASFVLTHTPAALAAWATALRTRVAGRKLAVGLEPSRGPRISALLPDDVRVRYPSPPATRAQYRPAVSPSRATDAPRDADDRLEWRLPQRDHLKAWRPDQAQTRTRPYLVDHRRRLVHDRTRRSHRLTARLKADGPQG